MKSIFEIVDEKFNLKNAIYDIKEVFEKEKVIDEREEYELVFGTEYTTSLEKYIDKYIFRDWKYRGIYLNVESYKSQLFGLYFNDDTSEEIYLRYLEYVYNMLKIFKTNQVYNKLAVKALENNIKSIASRVNIDIVKIEDKYVFVSKNMGVEVLKNSLPKDITLMMLSYLDINNGINEKQTILKEIATYLEGIRDEFDEKNKSSFMGKVCSDVFYYFNNFNIRHNNQKGVNIRENLKQISTKELENIYDNVFHNCVLLLLLRQQKSFIEKTEEYKKMISKNS